MRGESESPVELKAQLSSLFTVQRARRTTLLSLSSPPTRVPPAQMRHVMRGWTGNQQAASSSLGEACV
jgi:hypothetical protein